MALCVIKSAAMNVLGVFLATVAVAYAYTDPECSGYDHSNYGCQGECISTSSCSGSKYISNLCPTQGATIKCCFTADSDSNCATYNHATYGQVGHCIDTSQCPSNNYISNLCPTKAAGVKCCFSHPTGTCGSTGTCSTTVRNLACDILDDYYGGRITLLTINPSGVNDGADSLSNIQDTCNGNQAKRSSYSCSSGTSPGGYVCLDKDILEYLLDLISSGYHVQVNSISGACHSTTSYHYQGKAVDLQYNSGNPYTSWMNMCADHGAIENLGPGDSGHSTHTHCTIP